MGVSNVSLQLGENTTQGEGNQPQSTSGKRGQRGDLQPKFGALPVNEITREGIKELIARLLEKGLAKNTIRNAVATLRVALNQAFEDGLVGSNPAVRLSKFFKQAKSAHKIDFLTADEVPLFLEAAKAHDANRRKGEPEYFALFLAAIHTGMRAGELAGLQ